MTMDKPQEAAGSSREDRAREVLAQHCREHGQVTMADFVASGQTNPDLDNVVRAMLAFADAENARHASLTAPIAWVEDAQLGRFGHHPDARIDYECEIDALIGIAYERLTMGGHADLEERIAKAMDFRALSTPGELRWLNQTFRGVREIYAVKPAWVKWPEDKLATLTPVAEPATAASGGDDLPDISMHDDQPFVDAWRKMEAKGYMYGDYALENVHLGWQLALATITTDANTGLMDGVERCPKCSHGRLVPKRRCDECATVFPAALSQPATTDTPEVPAEREAAIYRTALDRILALRTSALHNVSMSPERQLRNARDIVATAIREAAHGN